jgi:hypothetical protein
VQAYAQTGQFLVQPRPDRDHGRARQPGGLTMVLTAEHATDEPAGLTEHRHQVRRARTRRVVSGAVGITVLLAAWQISAFLLNDVSFSVLVSLRRSLLADPSRRA